MIDEATRLLLRVKSSPDDQAAQAEAAAWQRQTAAHARAWMTAQKVWALTGQIGADHPVFETRRRPMPLRTVLVRRPVSRRGVMTGAIAAAAAACIAIIVAPFISLRWESDYRTGVGETQTVALPDGTKVQLDTDSAIAMIDSDEGRGVRLLAGRAWFEVAKDARRPFRVTASDVTVTVTGTQFDVGLTDRAVEVALAEGSVRADYPTAPGSAALVPGDRFRFELGARQARMSSVPIDAIASWRRGKLRTEGATIAEIVDQLRPYYSGRIIITDDAFAAQRVTGTFDTADPVTALRTVVEPHAGRVQRITPWLLVVSAP